MVSDVASSSLDQNHGSAVKWPVRILRAGTCACFVGWAWQHLRWSVPYDAVLWHPDYFGWLARRLGISWESYIADVMTDGRILTGVRTIGLAYFALGIISLTARRDTLVRLVCLVLGSVLIATASWSQYVDAAQSLATLVEQGGQVLTPVVLILALRCGARDPWTIAVALLAFWTTFAGHGIYATGLAPTPGRFFGLVHAVLGLGPEATAIFLKTAGVLDFFVCVGVLIPILRLGCLTYATVWGLLTAMARPVAGMSIDVPWWGTHQFLHEAVLRMPHACLPLFLFLVLRRKQNLFGKNERNPADVNDRATRNL